MQPQSALRATRTKEEMLELIAKRDKGATTVKEFCQLNGYRQLILTSWQVSCMLSLNPGIRYWLYQAPASIGKSFDGLCGIVTNDMKAPLLSGDVFIFFNRRRTHIKVLQWQQDGFGIYYKRLEQDTFERPQPDRKESLLSLSINNSS